MFRGQIFQGDILQVGVRRSWLASLISLARYLVGKTTFLSLQVLTLASAQQSSDCGEELAGKNVATVKVKIIAENFPLLVGRGTATSVNIKRLRWQ